MKIKLGIEATCFAKHGWERSIAVYVQNVLSKLGQEKDIHPFLFSHDFHEDAVSVLSSEYKMTLVEHSNLFWRNQGIKELEKLENINLLWFPFHVIPWFKTNIPMVTTVHDLSFIIKPFTSCSLKTTVYFSIALFNASVRSKKIIAISQTTADDLVRFFPWTARKIRVCPHGIPEDVRITSEKGFPKRSPGTLKKLLFLDGGNQRKRFDKALLACEKIREITPIQLTVTGSIDEIRKRCQDVLGKIPAYIELPGFLPRADLLKQIQETDILLYLSHYEGFGFPILEALALGCPVVCFDGKAEREIGKQFVSFAKSGDAEDVCKAVLDIINRPGTEDKTRQAQKHALHYSWKESARLHREVFEEALSS